MFQLEQKLNELKAFRFAKAGKGNASNAEDFINQIILLQFEKRDEIKKLHTELMKYINSDDATYFIRAYGSFKRENYGQLRRGFLTKYSNNIEYSFCDNTFALLFSLMKLSGIVFSSEEINKYFKQRELTCGFGETSLEKELSSFTRANTFPIKLNSEGRWYIAHIHSVGANYEGFIFSSKRDQYFPIGDRLAWLNVNKVRVIDRAPCEEELAILKAHFIRLTHPLNNFMVPNTKTLVYNRGSSIGEETELIQAVKEHLKKAFPGEYAEMERVIYSTKMPTIPATRITDIVWGADILVPKGKAMTERKERTKIVHAKQHIKKQETDIQKLLHSMGKEAFLNFYLPLKSDGEIDEAKLAVDQPRSAEWETKQSRLSVGKRIFREGLEGEALQIIMASKRLAPNLIALAERYYDALQNETSHNEDLQDDTKKPNDSLKSENDVERHGEQGVEKD